MTAQSGLATSPTLSARSAASASVYNEGIIAGVIGAATIAAWFFALDALQGRPLYTPTVLGTALFGDALALESPQPIGSSLEMALMFTWVHVLVFAVLGGVAARLLALAEREPNYGFGILLLFVVFEFGFIVLAMTFAEGVLHALAWPAILVGNVLAAAAMATYFYRHHPNLIIRP